jgi:cytochrome o ubiquinol oxidase subunit 2
MHFDTVATSRADFDAWIAHARQSPLSLDKATYEALEKPSEKNPVTVYANVAPRLFDHVADQYMHSAANDPICSTANTPPSIEHTGARLPARQAGE